MSLAKKTVLIIVLVTIVLFSLEIMISNYFFIRSFETLETQQIERNIRRVEDTFSNKLNTLASFNRDWAEWDDTYYFAKEFNQVYVDKNLMDDTFVTGDFNVILYINVKGGLVYGKLLDLNTMQATALPDTLSEYVSGTVDTNIAKSPSGFLGITAFAGRPLLTSCRPILTSMNEGPSTGYLVVGRFVDEVFTLYLSETVGFPVDIIPLQGPSQSPEREMVMPSIKEPGAVFIKAQQKNMISGYAMVKDTSGNPAFIFKVTLPRDIRTQGLKTITYIHSSLLLIAIVFCGVTFFLLKYLILSRLTALGTAVSSIGSKGEISSRVKLKGNDELTRLSKNINGMLESLEKSELRRQSQKELIGHIITYTPNGVIVLDENGHVILINDSFRKMFNLNNPDITDIKLEDLPDMLDITIEVNNFRLSRMTSFKKEIQRVRNGTEKIYIATFTRLKEEELYILYLTDISEERVKQERLYLTDRLASIGEMASGIAHELNNPLTSIIGLSEIVMRDEVPESIREDMGLIKSESHRAANIVRNLLSFARKNATFKQAININAIITDVLKLRSYEQSVNNITIVRKLDPNLPDVMVDHSQIQQVFINIILNAEYAIITNHGKGTIEIKTETAGDMLKVSFTDDGLGIEPGNLRHIFDPFFTTKEDGKGTGLGLSISFGIVTAHNGRIYATSEYGKGATFVVELPLHKPDKKEIITNA
jgi:signal transduction histidine kinase/sensor domain CHASE-containing protein